MTSWPLTVAARLAQTAGPAFTRWELPRPDAAGGIRLAALRLAGEADGLNLGGLAETFREIAAGITLLELRHTGERPPTEIILLAID